MRLRLAALLAAGVLAGAAAGAEDRRLMTEAESAEWQAVGRLNVAGRRFCTATLVAPDTVLTAAHCVVNPRTGRPHRAESIHFVAGYRLGAYAAHRWAARVTLSAEYASDAPRPASDVATITLDREVDAVEPLALRATLRPGAEVTVASYARDRPEAASLDRSCTVLARTPDLATLDCAATWGMSGAAVITGTGAARAVAGVVVASGRAERRDVTLVATSGGAVAW